MVLVAVDAGWYVIVGKEAVVAAGAEQPVRKQMKNNSSLDLRGIIRGSFAGIIRRFFEGNKG